MLFALQSTLPEQEVKKKIYGKKRENASLSISHRCVSFPVDPLILCYDDLSPLQALFTHVENTIAHQRCLGARHKWEAEKPKQGQNERLESTVAARTMPANYSSQSAAEQAADLKRVCLRVINLNEISHISCIKC